MNAKPSRRAVVYARFSTDKQDARSIDDQSRRCQKWATDHGYEVVQVFSDEGISGGHTERPGLQAILAEASKLRRRSFDYVLVDDLSRLSRDVFDMGQIVFKELAGLNVQVIDVMTGMSSDAPVARQLFTSIGSGNDLFLQMVRAETHRGLEGRALGGFWTGGRVYGYTMVKEANPADPEHPRAVPTVNEAEADVIRRIFALYVRGYGIGSIADKLNAEGIAAPYDNSGYGKVGGKGWGQSTVRNILQNERYAGKWVWNKRKWIHVPGKKARRCIIRPESEWTVTMMPELAIIDAETFKEVQQRFEERSSHTERKRSGVKTVHLLSGILKCGACGSNMSIVGSKKKGGVTYYDFGCSANHTKGEAICKNSVHVSEKKVNAAIVSAVQGLISDDLTTKFVARFNATLKKLEAAPKVEADDIAARVAEVEARIRNLTLAIAKVGYSDALGDQLKKEEAILGGLRARSASGVGDRARKAAFVDPEIVTALLEDVLKLVENAPAEGRQALKNLFGSVVATYEAQGEERRYVLTGTFNLAVALGVQKHKPRSSKDLEGGVSDSACCGGRI